ncbi:MAG: GNAT family N-acetyltransferase [Limnobacter sp.]|nr:GNAT family N-acetyltransferase [Limnobacter sp.]
MFIDSMFVDAMNTDQFSYSECRIKLAVDDWELRQAQKLRNQVFVVEQGIFQTSDHDLFDIKAHTLVATTGMLGIPDAVVGTVRIHEQEPGVWMGSRLAVDRSFRSDKGLGKALIRMAVCSARAQGCKTFYANVQLQNLGLFQKLGWLALGEVNVHGVEHMFMQANLDLYPIAQDPSRGFVHLINQPRHVASIRELA